VKLERDVVQVLEDVLNLDGKSASFRTDTPLLGAIPELDSMAVAGLIATLEERFGFIVADDEIDGRIFETVGTLVGFVKAKLPA
jgi:acyl carrier protein